MTKLEKGQRMVRPTLLDVARAAGVDKSTASRGLRGDATIGLATRQRLQQVAAHLNYVPNASALHLRQTQTNVLAIMSSLSHQDTARDSVLMDLLPIITSAANDQGYDILLFRPGKTYTDLQPYERLVGGHYVDGIILVGIEPQDPRLDYLCAKEFPHILYGRSDRDLRQAQRYHHPWVEVDNQQGAFLATEYLLQLGHRRIAFLGTDVTTDSQLICVADRHEGYSAALKAGQIAYDPALFVASVTTEEEGHTQTSRLLALPDPPTAIITGDAVAFGVMQAAQNVGRTIGQDFAVVGCDGLALGAFMRPTLTTLRLPFAVIGRCLVDLLVQEIQGVEQKERHILVTPELLIRDSTVRAKLPPNFQGER